MRWGVIVFPGSCDDHDVYDCLKRVLKQKVEFLWHKDRLPAALGCVVLPGGFSYGDYLRCGAMGRFSPIMGDVVEFAARGGSVLGICNGFQILCEAGLLPGALIRNRSLQFRCEHIFLKTLTQHSPFTNQIPENKLLRVPIAHGEGCYFADEDTLSRLKANNQILWQYVNADGEASETSNPNGSLQNIAGICSESRLVAGLMPHPERACESILGSDDGRLVFESLIHFVSNRKPTALVTA